MYAVLAQALIDLLSDEHSSELQIDSALEFVLSFKTLVRRLRKLSPEEKREWRAKLVSSLK